MPKEYWGVNAECPFFKWAEAQPKRITCEGVTEECNLSLRFQSKSGMKAWAKEFCCGDYQACRIYRMLEEKYT